MPGNILGMEDRNANKTDKSPYLHRAFIPVGETDNMQTNKFVMWNMVVSAMEKNKEDDTMK